MRNVFDQYTSHENRLTHALACALAEDRELLRCFLREVAKSTPPDFRTAQIVEQSLPGEPELAEDEAERTGLPDMWIHDGENWSILIESKVAAKVSIEQLNRHLRTAERRGFTDTLLLVIVASDARKKMPQRCVEIRWPMIYGWAHRHSHKSEWARRLFEYMEVAEGRMTEDGYLEEGTLTEFNGIPFGEDRPYNYTEAKRNLRLATKALRSKRELQKSALADLDGPGRPAITGQQERTVWDYIPITRALKDKPFTKSPHLTLAIGTDRALAALTMPNGIDSRMRKNLVALGKPGLASLLDTVTGMLLSALRSDPGAVPCLIMQQRRYPNQRSTPTRDALLEFDLRTAFGSKFAGGQPQIRPQVQWLEASISAFFAKRSNLEMQVGAIFPYRRSKLIHSPKAIDLFASTWSACKPLLEVMLRH